MVQCSCPAAAELATIPAMTCGETFGQIQKLAFQRLYDASGNLNTFTEAEIKELTNWTAKMSVTSPADLNTKIVVTPFVEAPAQEGGDAITYGGGNDTLGGVEEVVGRSGSTMTYALRKYPQSIIKALKALQCETNLGVFLFSENGAIEAIKGGTEQAPVYSPIPIRSLFVGDKVHGGLEEPDSNELRFAFLPNYSDDLAVVVPNFNPLTELVIS